MAPGKRKLEKVKIVMSSWACEDGAWTADCETTQGATFDESITLTLYRVNSGDPDLPGTEIIHRTRTFAVPFRPSADPIACPANPTGWHSAKDDACYNGKAFNIVFTFPGTHLPDELVYGVSYNTSTSGNDPDGVRSCQGTIPGCPDDSLNVGVAAGLPVRGSDVYPAGIFIDRQSGGDCTSDPSVADSFSLDACTWTGANPLVRFVVRK